MASRGDNGVDAEPPFYHLKPPKTSRGIVNESQKITISLLKGTPVQKKNGKKYLKIPTRDPKTTQLG